MKVAYICFDRGVPIFGNKGSSVHVQEILNALIRKDATITLITNKTGNEKPLKLKSIKVVEVPLLNNKSENINSSVFQDNEKIIDILTKEGPFDLVYERYSLWSFGGMEYSHNNKIPGILEVNSPLIEEQSQYRKLENRQLAEIAAERAYTSAKVILAVSEGVSSYLQKFSSTKGKINVVSNGVNPELFPDDIEPSFQSSTDTFIVGFVGTLKPWHGLPILIDAFNDFYSKIPNSKLLIVGDGPERKNLQESLKEKNLLHAAEFTGNVEREDIPSLLASMNVAVAPYPKLENFYFSPLKVYEYMMAGIPVVASNIGQLSQLIRHRENGFLVTPGDSKELSATLLMLQQNISLCKKIGQSGRKTVLQDNTWEIIVNKILSAAGMSIKPQICKRNDTL